MGLVDLDGRARYGHRQIRDLLVVPVGSRVGSGVGFTDLVDVTVGVGVKVNVGRVCLVGVGVDVSASVRVAAGAGV